MATQKRFEPEHSRFSHWASVVAHFLFTGIVAAALALIGNSVVTLVVVVWPILRPLRA